MPHSAKRTIRPLLAIPTRPYTVPVKRAKRSMSPFRKAPPRPATARQSEFLACVRDMTRELGQAPSAERVGERMGISRLGARRQLQALEAKGLLRDIPKVVSSGQWALTEAGDRALEEE